MYKNNFLTDALKTLKADINNATDMLNNSGLPVVANAFLTLGCGLENAIMNAEIQQNGYISMLLLRVYNIDPSYQNPFKLDSDVEDVIRFKQFITKEPLTLSDLSKVVDGDFISLHGKNLHVKVSEDIWNVFEIYDYNDVIGSIRSAGINVVNPVDGELFRIGISPLPVDGDVQFLNKWLRPLFLPSALLETNNQMLLNNIFSLLEEMYQFRAQNTPTEDLELNQDNKLPMITTLDVDKDGRRYHWPQSATKFYDNGSLVHRFHSSGNVDAINSAVHETNRTTTDWFDLYFVTFADQKVKGTLVISSYPVGSSTHCAFIRSDGGIWSSDIPVEHFKTVLLYELKLRLTKECAKEYLAHKESEKKLTELSL